jgi:hypothetical protein
MFKPVFSPLENRRPRQENLTIDYQFELHYRLSYTIINGEWPLHFIGLGISS